MKTKANKNSKRGFVPIRRGIYEHLADGRMSGKEWMLYSTLHLKADHESGICMKVSAPVLSYLLQIHVRAANRLLASLEKKGYIRRLNHRGQVRHYPVVINKYLTSNGLLINARKTKSLNEIAYYTEHDCLLTVFQQSFNCPANVLQMSCLQEIKNIRIEENEKKAQPSSSSPPALPIRVQQVFEKWNEYKGKSVLKLDKETHQGKKITWHSHAKVSKEIRSAIVNENAGESVADLCGAVDNYARVLLTADYWWSHVWALPTFLTVKYERRKDAEKKWRQFKPDNFIEEHYLTPEAKRRRAAKAQGPSVYSLAKQQSRKQKEQIGAEQTA